METTTQPYFYFNNNFFNTVGQVNSNLIKQDLQRGVTRLSEDAYCKYHGATRTSLFFLGALTNILGAPALQGRRAELTYSEKHHYTLTIQTLSGYTLVFKGVSGGYFGEGTRGAHDILKFCGFSPKQSNRPFEKETFTASRRV